MKKKKSEESIRIEKFEKLFILTYQTLYRHAELIFDTQEENRKELLILTYMEAFLRSDQLQKEKEPVDWLLKRADFLAETKLSVSRDMLESSYAEEKMQSKEAKKENRSKFDEASLLLEIEDRLQITEEKESAEPKNLARTIVQMLFSLVFFAAAVFAIGFGVSKVQNKVSGLRNPFRMKSFEMAENETERKAEMDSSVMEAQEEGETKESALQENDIWIPVGGRVVYLSEDGDVLYSLSAEETEEEEVPERNSEVQTMNGWIYYLPCPERVGSQLTRVNDSLSHTLYRLEENENEAEQIAEDVDDFYLWKDEIYIYQYGSVKKVDQSQDFNRISCTPYAVVENGEIYLYDTIGRMVTAGEEGTIHYEDRLFQMSSNRIRNVEIDSRTTGQTSFVLEAFGDGNGIYKKSERGLELFESRGRTIDSYCLAGDWIYYSSYVRRDEENIYYSEIYRRNISGAEEAELLHGEFVGRMAQMSYSETTGQIYATYLPESWKSNHGVIAVLSLDGQLCYLDDNSLRGSVATTGNDVVQFVLTQDGNTFCYWMDCEWEPGKQAVALWRKVLVIPEQNRISIE